MICSFCDEENCGDGTDDHDVDGGGGAEAAGDTAVFADSFNTHTTGACFKSILYTSSYLY